MATGNFYPSIHGIFAYAMNDDIRNILGYDEDEELTEGDYSLGSELCDEDVMQQLESTLTSKGYSVDLSNLHQNAEITIDNLVTLRVEGGYYEGAQIILDTTENEAIAESEYLDLEDDYYQKVYVYEDEDGNEQYTDTPDELELKASDITDILYNVAWVGDTDEEPVELSPLVYTNADGLKYTKLDHDVINALKEATTAYQVAWQASNGETAYTKM